MEERREGLWVETSAGTSVRLLFQDERTTLAVLTFLWSTRVGRMVTLAPPEEEWEELEGIVLQPGGEEGQDSGGEEDGPGPPRDCSFPLSAVRYFLCQISSGGRWGGDRVAPP